MATDSVRKVLKHYSIDVLWEPQLFQNWLYSFQWLPRPQHAGHSQWFLSKNVDIADKSDISFIQQLKNSD